MNIFVRISIIYKESPPASYFPLQRKTDGHGGFFEIKKNILKSADILIFSNINNISVSAFSFSDNPAQHPRT
ncbi:MAG: hypothetical protein LBB89_09585 [Treponema sp.]|nr:hypothetical protein [Treponema sp.]